VIDLESAAKAV